MKKASEVLGLKVMGIREGLESGLAQDFMIDAGNKSVQYLILKDSDGYGFRAIAIGDVLGIGADYVMTPTVENAKKMYESKEILEVIEKGFFILGSTALSSAGDIVGRVTDFSFDEKSGGLDTLILDNGQAYDGQKIASLAGKMVFLDPTGSSILTPPTPVPEEESSPRHSLLEQESMAYLLGKVVREDVTSGDGTLRITAGTVLTEELLAQTAKHSDVLLALTLEI